MPDLISCPSRVTAAGNIPKVIDEFVGRVSNNTDLLSIARMKSASGWKEPGQTPEFDEYTVVLAGTLRVEHKDGVIEVKAGQAVHAKAGEWVRYSTPAEETEYLSVCIPAFTPDTVHRDAPES